MTMGTKQNMKSEYNNRLVISKRWSDVLRTDATAFDGAELAIFQPFLIKLHRHDGKPRLSLTNPTFIMAAYLCQAATSVRAEARSS